MPGAFQASFHSVLICLCNRSSILPLPGEEEGAAPAAEELPALHKRAGDSVPEAGSLQLRRQHS